MAISGVSTETEELPESRVRVQASVAPEEIDRRVAQSAKTLGRSLRVPGFRAGKVPPPIVIQRVGREAVLDDAVRDSLPGWYAAAVDDARLHPVGEPAIDMGELPEAGEPLTFSIEIGVRPQATLGDYKGVEAPRPDDEVADEAIDTEIESLRERAARLDTVQRPAVEGDSVVMDFLGSIDGVPFEGGEGRDQMVELGSGRLVPGFEDQLQGASAGDERTVTIQFPDDYGAEALADKEATFAVTVKEVKAKALPEVDEDFAVEQGFDTVDELREDIRTRLAEEAKEHNEGLYREAVLDAVVANATVEVPPALIEARARELWDQMMHSLSHQGIQKEMYLQITGKSEDEVIEEGKPDAEIQLRRDAVLAAVIEAESIDPSDDELLQALAADAERNSIAPEKLLERIRSSGRLDVLKEDVAHVKALDRLVEAARPAAAAPAE